MAAAPMLLEAGAKSGSLTDVETSFSIPKAVDTSDTRGNRLDLLEREPLEKPIWTRLIGTRHASTSGHKYYYV